MAKAVGEPDANLPGEGSLILGDGRPLYQVACVSQVAQGNQTVGQSRRPAEGGQAAACDEVVEVCGPALGCPPKYM
jgi:hypothetical protein